MTRDNKQEAKELLRREEGVRIPEIAEELGISTPEARKLVNQIASEHELGESGDFRYKILQ